MLKIKLVSHKENESLSFFTLFLFYPRTTGETLETAAVTELQLT